ncbi:MAG: isoaspartyl peptidase/L-asparaginase [Planctomycetota bacterium]|jgi:N4-(beta-N-acetylglucosaminyl)-L-asparaginase
MHGPTHKAGAVAALRNIRQPSSVALEVLRRTDHVLLVGDGALEFARSVGFKEQDLLTKQAREAWLRWKADLSPRDDWLDTDQQVEIPHTDGTIHMSAVDANGDLGSCTSTSGLSYKIPGRVGDSPLVGAGLFCDNEVGAAGSTGRGESVIQSAGAFQVVRNMADGLEPTEACLRVLKWIADHTKRRDLLDERGEPDFQVVMYALRKDGAYGAAAMRPGRTFTIHDGPEARTEPCEPLFGK